MSFSNKQKQSFFNFLFVFILFLLVSSFFFNYLNKEKTTIYQGKYATYFKNYENGEEKWFYSFFWKNKRLDVPLYSNPFYFENIPLEIINKPIINKNILIVFYQNDNLSVITVATFNLARIFTFFDYMSNKNLFVGYFNNSLIEVVNSSMEKIDEGPLVCNSDLTTFIVLNASSSEKIIINGSCIYLNGNNKGLLSTVDLFNVLFTLEYNIR